jgi:hypothetical protein
MGSTIRTDSSFWFQMFVGQTVLYRRHAASKNSTGRKTRCLPKLDPRLMKMKSVDD